MRIDENMGGGELNHDSYQSNILVHGQVHGRQLLGRSKFSEFVAPGAAATFAAVCPKPPKFILLVISQARNQLLFEATVTIDLHDHVTPLIHTYTHLVLRWMHMLTSCLWAGQARATRSTPNHTNKRATEDSPTILQKSATTGTAL